MMNWATADMIKTRTQNQLTFFAEKYSDHCSITKEDDETGYRAFENDKGRLSFRPTAPYSEERRQVASEWAKTNSLF